MPPPQDTISDKEIKRGQLLAQSIRLRQQAVDLEKAGKPFEATLDQSQKLSAEAHALMAQPETTYKPQQGSQPATGEGSEKAVEEIRMSFQPPTKPTVLVKQEQTKKPVNDVKPANTIRIEDLVKQGHTVKPEQPPESTSTGKGEHTQSTDRVKNENARKAEPGDESPRKKQKLEHAVKKESSTVPPAPEAYNCTLCRNVGEAAWKKTDFPGPVLKGGDGQKYDVLVSCNTCAAARKTFKPTRSEFVDASSGDVRVHHIALIQSPARDIIQKLGRDANDGSIMTMAKLKHEATFHRNELNDMARSKRRLKDALEEFSKASKVYQEIQKKLEGLEQKGVMLEKQISQKEDRIENELQPAAEQAREKSALLSNVVKSIL